MDRHVDLDRVVQGSRFKGACLTEDTFHRNGTLDGVKVGLEEIFHENKVDLCLSGHEHSYGKFFKRTVLSAVYPADTNLFFRTNLPRLQLQSI